MYNRYLIVSNKSWSIWISLFYPSLSAINVQTTLARAKTVTRKSNILDLINKILCLRKEAARSITSQGVCGFQSQIKLKKNMNQKALASRVYHPTNRKLVFSSVNEAELEAKAATCWFWPSWATTFQTLTLAKDTDYSKRWGVPGLEELFSLLVTAFFKEATRQRQGSFSPGRNISGLQLPRKQDSKQGRHSPSPKVRTTVAGRT